MRTALVDTFYETLAYCFESVLGDMLGGAVRESIYSLIERNGIKREDTASRFDDVVEVLVKSLGTCSRVVVHRTVAEMYRQYSQRMDFSYTDSLRDRLILLKEASLANHLLPRRLYESSSFFEGIKVGDPSGAATDLFAARNNDLLAPQKKTAKT